MQEDQASGQGVSTVFLGRGCNAQSACVEGMCASSRATHHDEVGGGIGSCVLRKSKEVPRGVLHADSPSSEKGSSWRARCKEADRAKIIAARPCYLVATRGESRRAGRYKSQVCIAGLTSKGWGVM